MLLVSFFLPTTDILTWFTVLLRGYEKGLKGINTIARTTATTSVARVENIISNTN